MKSYFLRLISLVIIPALFCTCTRYYSVQTHAQSTSQVKFAAIDSLNRQKKYFLLHTDSVVYAINNISLNMTDSTIAGFLTNVPVEHSLYIQPHKHFIWGKQRIYEKSEAGILNEVHLYSRSFIKDSAFNIPVQHIQKIETIEDNKKKTTTINAAAIVFIVGVVTASIVALVSLSQ